MLLNSYNPNDKVLLAVDCIIFGFAGNSLKVLLIKRDFEPEMNKWSLIGGFLRKDENLNQTANRVLSRLTGLCDIYMEQLYTFSEIDRDPADRTISVAYYALINIEDENTEFNSGYNAKWFDFKEVPKLIFDHDSMLARAISRLRYQVSTKPIGFELLPRKFTMLQLQKLYETILDKELDKRNFINKIRSMDILIKLDEKEKTTSRKGSFLYRFDEKKYADKLENFSLFL